ncbi:unnamed protein product [Angiostrongylus costaricensis]|uniref:Pecanex-like protein n=1 Tax=Angiostrongylus costaricensis TaxID=334426 RepID=A0A0R3PQ45_ANGCS|nr:unnamed protein product [Angiostrongylus costaricensis]
MSFKKCFIQLSVKSLIPLHSMKYSWWQITTNTSPVFVDLRDAAVIMTILTYLLLTRFNGGVNCEKNSCEICCTFSKCSIIIFRSVISSTSSAQIAFFHLVKNIFMNFANGRLLESPSLFQCSSFQTACPFLLLHIPLYTMYLLLFTGITSSKLINDVIGTLMSLFPFISPLLTLIFTDDYRNFIANVDTWLGWCVGPPPRPPPEVGTDRRASASNWRIIFF